MAAGTTFMVTEAAPVTEMTLDAPLVRSTPDAGPNVLLVRELKKEQKDGTGHNQ